MLLQADQTESFEARRRTADHIFRGALIFNAALTAFWLFALLVKGDALFFRTYQIDRAALGRIAAGIVFFYVVWGVIWYVVKNLLLKYVVGLSKEERRRSFSSRMNEPYDVPPLVARYSERRIRVVDMIGRRGRFMTLALAGFFYLYGRVVAEPSPDFATLFLQDNLFDAVAGGWIFLAFYYVNGFVAATFTVRSRGSWTGFWRGRTAC